MEFKQRSSDFMRHAKNFCFSENFRVFCTGQRAFICDRELNLIYTIEKLSYVYAACISPNETQVLLISNSNIFYLVDLKSFEIKKYVIRGKYNDNLEGRGCWSFQGKEIYFSVCNKKTLNSALRCYNLSDNLSYKDMLIEKYWLVSVKPVKELNKYLLVGLDREKAMLDRMDCWNLIWFDGVSFEEYPIRNIDLSENIIHSAEYEVITNTVIIYAHSKTFRCDIYGRNMEEISFSDYNQNKLMKLSDSFAIDNILTEDRIYKVFLSIDGKKYYVGTNFGIYVLDVKTKTILGIQKIDYGVQNIMEISPNLILVSTWNGVKEFEIMD